MDKDLRIFFITVNLKAIIAFDKKKKMDSERSFGVNNALCRKISNGNKKELRLNDFHQTSALLFAAFTVLANLYDHYFSRNFINSLAELIRITITRDYA